MGTHLPDMLLQLLNSTGTETMCTQCRLWEHCRSEDRKEQ